mmetsp:Transcript_8586/g.23063  ORF Transcript_8586/g.23063 Transcript_8586/m.23063 type:complete len:254 (-) Transcript_8586:54-815(-)
MGNALNSIIRMHKKLPPIIQGYPALDLHAVGQHTVEHLTGDLVNLCVKLGQHCLRFLLNSSNGGLNLPGDLGLGLVVLCIQLILLVALLSLDHLGHFHAGVLQDLLGLDGVGVHISAVTLHACELGADKGITLVQHTAHRGEPQLVQHHHQQEELGHHGWQSQVEVEQASWLRLLLCQSHGWVHQQVRHSQGDGHEGQLCALQGSWLLLLLCPHGHGAQGSGAGQGSQGSWPLQLLPGSNAGLLEATQSLHFC